MAESPILTVDSVVKHYGGLTAVANLSFSVARGQVQGIIGPNGAGKSTTFDLISGFRQPDSGSILLNGQSLIGWPAHKIARMGLARSFQHVQDSEDLTVEDVLITAALMSFSMRAARKVSHQMLERLNLGSARGQHMSALSLPDRKMVEFGRCIIAEPQIVLLDEIMAGLTLAEAERPIEIMRDSCALGVAFVVVEHLMPIIVRVCDQVVAMDFGEQIALGTADEVLADPRVRATYLGSKRDIHA